MRPINTAAIRKAYHDLSQARLRILAAEWNSEALNVNAVEAIRAALRAVESAMEHVR